MASIHTTHQLDFNAYYRKRCLSTYLGHFYRETHHFPFYSQPETYRFNIVMSESERLLDIWGDLNVITAFWWYDWEAYDRDLSEGTNTPEWVGAITVCVYNSGGHNARQVGKQEMYPLCFIYEMTNLHFESDRIEKQLHLDRPRCVFHRGIGKHKTPISTKFIGPEILMSLVMGFCNWVSTLRKEITDEGNTHWIHRL